MRTGRLVLVSLSLALLAGAVPASAALSDPVSPAPAAVPVAPGSAAPDAGDPFLLSDPPFGSDARAHCKPCPSLEGFCDNNPTGTLCSSGPGICAAATCRVCHGVLGCFTNAHS